MQYADIEIKDGGVYSRTFGDCYFSVPDGIEEAFYVYPGAHQLSQRISASTNNLHIAELGFGTGLNCALSLAEFLSVHNPDCRIRYTAIEKYPVRNQDILQLVSKIPGISLQLSTIWKHIVHKLPENYSEDPEKLRIRLSPGFDLVLYIGDALEQLGILENLAEPVDIWYLDGFSPAIDTGLWRVDILQKISSLSAQHASCSSFTAAGWIRRALADSGWIVERRQGFGRKRHMTYGRFEGAP